VEAFLRGYERLLLLPPDELASLRVGEVGELVGFPAAPAADSSPKPGPAPAGGAAVLTGVVAELNGLDAVDPAGNYSVAGGRVLRIPAVLEELRVRGWTGLNVYDLAGGLPLTTLAERLVRTAELAA
jgi:hypothetical protein